MAAQWPWEIPAIPDAIPAAVESPVTQDDPSFQPDVFTIPSWCSSTNTWVEHWKKSLNNHRCRGCALSYILFFGNPSPTIDVKRPLISGWIMGFRANETIYIVSQGLIFAVWIESNLAWPSLMYVCTYACMHACMCIYIYIYIISCVSYIYI